MAMTQTETALPADQNEILEKSFTIGINTNSVTKMGFIIAGIPYKEKSWYLDIKISGNRPRDSEVYSFSRTLVEDVYNDPYKGDVEVTQIVNVGQTYRFNDYYYFLYVEYFKLENLCTG